MKAELFDIEDIKLNPNNPRTITKVQKEKLMKSIKEFPQMLNIRPLVVDEDNMVLGGNMRYQTLVELGYKQVPVIKAMDLTPEQKQEFIIKDNIAFGEWDWDVLQTEWEMETLWDWGLDSGGFEVDKNLFDTNFKLAEGDKSPFQQITFTLSDEQHTIVKNAMSDIKQTEEFKYCETFGNENSNGNALYLLIQQWAEQKK